MGKVINILMAVIAYVCTATVITLAAAAGYLWFTEQLNDEKLFRMTAVFYDIDLQKIAEAHAKSGDDVPPEEPSLAEVERHQQLLDRNHEVKLLALERGSLEYHHLVQELREQADRMHRQAQELQERQRQHQALTTQENVATVVSQLEQLQPDVAKDSLMRWIDEGRMDDAILLMSRMAEVKLSKILRTFETDEELDKLHEIHQRILSRGADGAPLQKALNDLESQQARN